MDTSMVLWVGYQQICYSQQNSDTIVFLQSPLTALVDGYDTLDNTAI
jgi:hypothetical protein